MQSAGIRVVENCSWKKRSFKILSWKVCRWKVSVWVGKSLAKLERTERSWKVSLKLRNSEVQSSKFKWIWKIVTEVGRFQLLLIFPTAKEACQVRSKLSNFISNFPTSARTFQLRRELSNFIFPIPCRTIQLKTFQLLFFPTALSNNRYPNQLVDYKPGNDNKNE